MKLTCIMSYVLCLTIFQAKYDKKKEAVLEEMEIEASKLEKDIEDDFGEGKFSMVNM
jgi:hypothetical protein